VHAVHGRGGPPVDGADDDLGRIEEVGDRRGFAQELGIVDQFDQVAEVLAEDRPEDRRDQAVDGARTDGRAKRDGEAALAIATDAGRDLAGDLGDVAEVVRAIESTRACRHRRGRDRHRRAGLSTTVEPRSNPSIAGGGEKLVETRLEHRRNAGLEVADLGLADIDTDDLVTSTGQAPGSSTTDIAKPKYRNLHGTHRRRVR
jgi:hypothetical protein